MTRQLKLSATCVVATIALLVAGCSSLPTDPSAGNAGELRSAGGAPASPLASGSSEPSGEAGSDDGSGTGGSSGSSGEGGNVSATQSKSISRLLGGVVQAGRFKVIVPPLALRRDAVITVHQPDVNVNKVQLEISPASANNFLLPVVLEANCSYMPKQVLSLQAIWWWNPAAGRWELVLSSQVNLLGGTVRAALQHFSSYAVGTKAGW